MVLLQVKNTNPKKYCVRPNIGVVLPRSILDIIGFLLSLPSIFTLPLAQKSTRHVKRNNNVFFFCYFRKIAWKGK